jgi:hypothetical protein
MVFTCVVCAGLVGKSLHCFHVISQPTAKQLSNWKISGLMLSFILQGNEDQMSFVDPLHVRILSMLRPAVLLRQHVSVLVLG